MVRLEMLQEKDIGKIVEWNEGTDDDFLFLWAGNGYNYPITEEKIKRRFEEGANRLCSDTYIFKIVAKENGNMIGTIELTKIDRQKAFGIVGRFLIGDKNNRGMGYGKASLLLLAEKAFYDLKLEKLALKVFDFNTYAVRCYENVGFTKVKHVENARVTANSAWGAYEMALARETYDKIRAKMI
jgi:RimJ/RimL family protein N-acetyltransferase